MTSGIPSPLKSSTKIELGSEPTAYRCTVKNVPSPRPKNTSISAEFCVATSKSTNPSLLRSASSIATGPLPVINVVAGRKDKAQTPVEPDEDPVVEEELTLDLPVVELLSPDEELLVEELLAP